MVYTLNEEGNSDGELIKEPSLKNLKNKTLNKKLIEELFSSDLIS